MTKNYQADRVLPSDLKVGDTILVLGWEASIIYIEDIKNLWIFKVQDYHTKEVTTIVRYPHEYIPMMK